MKKLKAINGETMLVDDEDYEETIKYRWSIKNSKGYRQVVTYSRRKGLSDECASYKSLILGLGAKMTLFKNNNPLDLRKENIMAFDTKGELMSALQKYYKNRLSNKKPKKGANPKTKYIGVRFEPRDRTMHPWYAFIKQNRKRLYIGSFAKDEYAAYAYDKRAIERYGEDAMRNFPHLNLEEITEIFNKIKEEDAIIFCDYKSKNKQGKLLDITKTSKYIGVCRPKDKKKWKASIAFRNKEYRLGYFYTEEDAAHAYDRKAIELYGENAKLNFPNKQ